MFPSTPASRLALKVALRHHHHGHPSMSLRAMGTVTRGVEFDTIAREWRCKWSKDDDMKSLQRAQQALDDVLVQVKNTAGCKSVHRVVCGGNLDFKVITSIAADDFPTWKDKDFEPETTFLEALSSIEGITQIETQTYTFMEI